MDLSNYSHSTNSSYLTSSYPSNDSVSIGFNIDDWLDISSVTTDEPWTVAAPSSPPGSYCPSPLDLHSSSMVSDSASNPIAYSTTFTPTSDNPLWPIPDTILISTDFVVFYVNRHTLLSVSMNFFRTLTPISSEDKTKRVYLVGERSTVLNTILHIFYDVTGSATCFTDAATLLTAVDCLPKYGISLKSCVHSSTPLYELLISQAPLLPFDFYAFAANHEIEDLAVAVSPYTLHKPLWAISEQLAKRMGPIYFKRLFSLHLERRIAFERALMLPPPIHDLTKSCAFKDHNNMRSAWAEGVSCCLEWVAREGGEIFSDHVRSIFDFAMRDISCKDCQNMKDEHLSKILMQRSLAKRTI